MNTKHQPATPPYFIDQYGHIYRWEPTATGETSVPVANWQNSGSAKESALLVNRANAYPRLVDALRQMSEKLLSLSNGSEFDLSDSPKSYRSNVERFANDAASFLKEIGEA